MNITPVAAELFRTDGWIEMMNLTGALGNIAKRVLKTNF